MIRIWLLVGLLICLAGSAQARPPMTVILLPGTSLAEWLSVKAPHLHQLMETGALALMNTRTARLPSDHQRETPESAVLTLGAGARAAGRSQQMSYLPMLVAANTQLGYQIRLGNLTDALAAHHIGIACGGGPLAALLAAGSDRTVTSFSKLKVSNDQCLIWDAGPNISQADTLIGEAARQTAALHGRLLVLSPFASDDAYRRGERLTPILEWGENIPIGLLLSASTHRSGLVTNTDFAPTVADYFGLKREDFIVRPFGDLWKAVPAPASERTLLRIQTQSVQQAQGMKLLPYLAVALAIWMLAGTLLKLHWSWSLLPAALLTAALYSNSFVALIIWGSIAFLMAYVFSKHFGNQAALLALFAITAVSLIIDMLTGCRLMQRNLLGYSAIEGARYYGIGNEAMGVLIGALLVLAARFWPFLPRARWAVFLLFAAISLLLGSAHAGAKAGGVLVSLAAFGTLGFTLCGGRWTGRVVLALAVGIVSVMGMVAIGDALLGRSEHSHLGEAVRRIEWGGIKEAGDIVTRKLAVEAHLAYHSAWALLLWGGLVCLIVLWRRNKTETVEDSALKLGGMVAIAACLALNDAGVVASALCLIPIWCDSMTAIERKKPLPLRNAETRAWRKLVY